MGRRMNDPRSLGYGIALMANVALTKGDFQAALNFGNTGVSIARTPYDKNSLTRQGSMRLFCLSGQRVSRCSGITSSDVLQMVGTQVSTSSKEYGVSLCNAREDFPMESVV